MILFKFSSLSIRDNILSRIDKLENLNRIKDIRKFYNIPPNYILTHNKIIHLNKTYSIPYVYNEHVVNIQTESNDISISLIFIIKGPKSTKNNYVINRHHGELNKNFTRVVTDVIHYFEYEFGYMQNLS